MERLSIVSEVLRIAAGGKEPEQARLNRAATDVDQLSIWADAIEAVVGALGRKSGITVDDLGLPAIVPPVGDSAARKKAKRRDETRAVALRLLSGE
jgi:hypothetical protein